MRPAVRVETAHLLPALHERLMELLHGLSSDAWGLPTVAGSWSVRDVAAHLLDVQLRRVSMQRDGHFPPVGGEDLARYDALVAHLNRLNASWVEAMARVSPPLLVELLEVAGPACARVLAGLDPEAPALFPVAWAGEEESRNWFDVGRDYTELWHHQAQIRLAVGAEPLTSPRWLGPVLALAVRGLPRALAALERPPGCAVVLRCVGEAGGAWSAVASSRGWELHEGEAPRPAARVALPEEVAWRLFFNACSPAEARAAAEVWGEAELVEAALALRSVMV